LRYGTCIPSIEFGTKPLITRKNTGFAPGAAGKNDIEIRQRRNFQPEIRPFIACRSCSHAAIFSNNAMSGDQLIFRSRSYRRDSMNLKQHSTICKGCWQNLHLPVVLRGPLAIPFRSVGLRPSRMNPNT
jgi:hypothetical protein